MAHTSVDTFVYGVCRDDGLFYPSKVGEQFRYAEYADDDGHAPGHGQAAYWRAWHNMQSLSAQGHDPLAVLVDRAHEKGMEFIASLRLGSYRGMDVAHMIERVGDRTPLDGRGWVHAEVREHQLSVLRELAHDYRCDGIELDFAAPPAGSAPLLRPEDVAEYTDTITEWVREVRAMADAGPGGRRVVLGARVYWDEARNLAQAIDIRTMISEGLLDYVTRASLVLTLLCLARRADGVRSPRSDGVWV